MVVSTNA
ncbi:putative conserved repeat domain protein, partial [Vibrio parahaemolyticus EKP-021]